MDGSGEGVLIRRLIDKTNGLIKTGCLFLSRRTAQQLTPRAIGFIIEKYANQAGVENIRPLVSS